MFASPRRAPVSTSTVSVGFDYRWHCWVCSVLGELYRPSKEGVNQIWGVSRETWGFALGEQLLGGREQGAESDSFGGLLDLGDVRGRRREPDVPVPRILAVRECLASRHDGDPGLFRERHDPLRTAVHDVQADEVATFGLGPGGSAGPREQLAEHLLNPLKLRHQECAVLFHQGTDTGLVVKVAAVAKLIDLVWADGAASRMAQVPADVVRRGREQCQPGSGQCPLGRGAED